MSDPAFVRLTTPRLAVRRFTAADVDAFVAYRNDPEVARFQAWKLPYARSEAVAFLQSLHGAAPGTPGEWFQFAVGMLPEGNASLIGDCALCPSRVEPGQAELGFTFAREFQGAGYASEAVSAVLQYAFDRLGLRRVVAYTDTRNRPARKLLAGVGFRCEQHSKAILRPDLDPASEIFHSLLESEWRARG